VGDVDDGAEQDLVELVAFGEPGAAAAAWMGVRVWSNLGTAQRTRSGHFSPKGEPVETPRCWCARVRPGSGYPHAEQGWGREERRGYRGLCQSLLIRADAE